MRPKIIVTYDGAETSFFPKQIDREKRVFVGEMFRLLNSDEVEEWTVKNGVAPIFGRVYLAPVVVHFDQVKSVNVEAAMSFQLGEEFKVWASGADSERKLDMYKNSLKMRAK